MRSRSGGLGARVVAALLFVTLLPVLSATGAAAATGLPSAPLDLQAVQTDLDTLEITWDPPADDGGTSITGYAADCAWFVHAGDPAHTTHRATESPLRIDLSFLERGTGVRCDIAATVADAAGDGTESDPSTQGATARVGAIVTRTVVAPTVVDFGPAPGPSGWFELDVALPVGVAGAIDAECAGSDGSTLTAGSPVTILDGNHGQEATLAFWSPPTGVEYDCTARIVNALGEFRSPVHHATMPPGQPSSVTYGVLSPREVELAFEVADGGAPILEHEASCSFADPVVVAEGEPLIVDALSAGTSPLCLVRARNVNGWGPYARIVVDLPADVPAAPTGLEAAWLISGDDWWASTRASVRVMAGRSNGEPITRLEVRCDSSDGGVTVKETERYADGAPRPGFDVLSGLSRGHRYLCRARHRNAVGWGDWAPQVRLRIRPSRPHRPRWVTVRRVDPKVARVRVEAGRHERSAATVLLAACRSLDGKHRVTQRAHFSEGLRKGDRAKVMVDDLRKRKRYECRARLRNDAVTHRGWSRWSSWERQDARVGSPDGPRWVKARRAKPRVAKLRFEVGRTHGRRASGVKAVCKTFPGNDGKVTHRRTFAEVKRNGDRATVRVRGLRKGKVYRCKVRLRNDHGRGDWTDWYRAL